MGCGGDSPFRPMKLRQCVYVSALDHLPRATRSKPNLKSTSLPAAQLSALPPLPSNSTRRHGLPPTSCSGCY